jgi:hypothetical protein
MSDPIEEIAALTDGGEMSARAQAETATDAPAPEEPQEAAQGPRAWGYDPEALNRDYAVVLWGGRAVVVKEQPDGPIEDRVRVLSIEAFDHWFSNKFTELDTVDGKRKTVTWGRAWRADKRRRQYAGIEFFPNPDGAAPMPGYLNLWRGFAVEPAPEGSWSVFRDHLFNNVCQGDQALYDWVFGWFAHIVQRPRERVGTALVLRGPMGSGKTKVGEIIGSIFPAHYFQVDDPRYIVGQFNAHMASCLLLQAEEAVWAGDKHAEGRLKGLITSESQMIESKGIDPIRIRNFVRLMMTSNEDWVVPAGMDERRFCVLDVHPRCAQNHDYFAEMQAELDGGGRARLLYDLLHFDLGKLNLRQIPRTAALLEQKLRSLDPLDAWWLARLMEGAPTRGLDEWPRFVGADAIYGCYIKAADEVGAGRRRDRATFGERLRKLAPGIERKRSPRIEGEARRPWRYELPPLDDCRAAFEDRIGQPFAWPVDAASESEPSAPADDVVPL